ncbi:hypothetical protein BBP40_002130 [Aspergillus hancockii]|nr:hypothetical protein BBP40_002130 [Aspergillus hancockii]
MDPVRQARPCIICGALRPEDADDERALCQQCLHGSPAEPSTPVPAQEGDSGSELEKQTALYLKPPFPASQSESSPERRIHSQFDSATDAIHSTLGFQPVNVSESGGRPKGKERAIEPTPEPIPAPQPGNIPEGNSPKATTGVEESQGHSAPEQSTSTAAPVPIKKVKLKPACASCKRSKIRCTHREPMELDSGQASAEHQFILPMEGAGVSTDISMEQVSSAKMWPHLRPKSKREAAKAGSSKSSAPKPRGRPPKRKVAKPRITQKVANLGGGGEIGEEVNPPPPKRAKRGRKPAQPIVDTSAEASHMAMNNILTTQFQGMIRECEAKWDAVFASVEEAKHTFNETKGLMDRWLDIWKRGEV